MGLETTTNLIGNGVLTLLRNPDELDRLRADSSLIPSAVEELLRYESPSQHTARLAPADVELGGKRIQKRQAVIAVMGAGNRDPERFPEPDRLASDAKTISTLHSDGPRIFVLGPRWRDSRARSPSERSCGGCLKLRLNTQSPLVWRHNLGLRGLTSLPVAFAAND